MQMRNVRMLKLSAGPQGVRKPGDELSLTEAEAADLVSDRAAEYTDGKNKLETAAAKKPEETKSKGKLETAAARSSAN